MRFFRGSAILLWIAFASLVACSHGPRVREVPGGPEPENAAPPPQTPPHDASIDYSLADPAEGEILSLCVSDALFPIPDLAAGFLNDLAAIRSAYGLGALVSTRAQSRWTGEIEIQFDPTATHDFAVGDYYPWQELNAELGLIGTIPLELGKARLQFARHFNPCLAAESYMRLPGIARATAVFRADDGPEIIVGLSEWHGYTYLFRYAWDRCETGCLHELYYYFRFIEGEPLLVGKWNPEETDPPAWWSDVESEWIDCSCLPPPTPDQVGPPQPRRRWKNAN
jgi:hypothetical protein